MTRHSPGDTHFQQYLQIPILIRHSLKIAVGTAIERKRSCPKARGHAKLALSLFLSSFGAQQSEISAVFEERDGSVTCTELFLRFLYRKVLHW